MAGGIMYMTASWKRVVAVACPHCGAGEGRQCTTTGHYGTPPHRKRWKAAGVERPDTEQFVAEMKAAMDECRTWERR